MTHKKRGRQQRQRLCARLPRSCPADWLPNELWDLILNGSDSRGNAFLDPSQRVLLRRVCSRWHHIVGSPLGHWQPTHLLAARRTYACFDNSPEWTAGFFAGRIVSLGAALVFASERRTVADAGRQTNRPSREKRRQTRPRRFAVSSADVGLFFRAVGSGAAQHKGGTTASVGREYGREYVHALCAYMSGRAPDSDWTHGHVVRALVTCTSALLCVGRSADAVRFFSALAESNGTMGEAAFYHALLVVARMGDDDAPTLKRLLAAIPMQYKESPNPFWGEWYMDRNTLLASSWSMLMRTLSTRCIKAVLGTLNVDAHCIFTNHLHTSFCEVNDRLMPWPTKTEP